MCLFSGCVKLWRDDLALRDLKCPCGYTYWDIFQERFLRNIRDRTFDSDGRALPMQSCEARLRRDMDLKTFEASIRAQFITHCLSCGIRRRIDDGEAQAGFDTPGLLRALAELLEIAGGDYTSRGTSRTFQELPVSSPSLPTRQRQPSLSNIDQDSTRSTRNPANLDEEQQPLRTRPRARQEALLTRVPSASTERGSRTGSDSQRTLVDIAPITRADQTNKNPSSRRVKSREESRPETQPRYRSSRDEPRHLVPRDDEGVGDSGAPRPTLPALLAKFIAFGESQYASIATFCENNPEIWDEDPNSLQAAIRYYTRRGETDRVRQLAQRLLMLTLSWRQSETPEGQQKWLNKLSGSTRLREELDEKVDTLLENFR